MKKLISLILVLILLLSNINILEVYGNTVENNESSYSGGSGTASDPYKISSIEDLKDITSNLNKHFVQTQNIDISSIDDWTPIGTYDNPFNGIYDGNGYSISNLKITSGKENIGLFGYIGSGSVIKNVSLINPNITNSAINFVGSLVGYSNGGTISDSSTINGSVTGGYAIGGLVGVAKSSLISNSYFTGEVESENVSKGKIGGLVGYTNIISENHRSNIIQECYANAAIDGGQFTGGLIGDNTGVVRNSFSFGNVRGTNGLGSLIGFINTENPEKNYVENSYSTASLEINGSHVSQGLVGNTKGEEFIKSSFWNKDFTDSNTIDLQTKYPYAEAGWDFNDIWTIKSTTNDGYPFLVNLPKQKLRISGNFSVEDKEYNGTNEVAISSENLTLSGIFIDKDSNSVKLNPVASFNDSDIGENKNVDLSNSYLSGKYGFLYELDFTASPTALADIYGYADYTKTYYIETLTEGEYDIHSTSTESGLIGENTSMSSITIDGFTENTENSNNLLEGIISADGLLELKLYYDRDLYTVTFVDYDSRIIDTQKVKFGGNAISPSLPVREGHEFLGWNSNFNNITNDLTVTATWKAKDDVHYKVNYYTESTYGDYIIKVSETHSGTTNTTASAVALKLRGFILNEGESITSGKISADGLLELKLYYDRDLYTVTFVDHDSSIIDTQKVKYEGNAVLPENPYRSGYRFTGWDGSYENITKDTVIITEYIKRKSKSPLKNTTDEEKRDEVLKIEVPSVDGHWSEEAVEELVSRKIIINYETFQPEESITRIEFADYIIRALDLYKENNPYKINFTDISNDHILSDSLKSALEHGIIKGYEDKTFRPEKTISRQEAMVMYARAMKILGVNLLDLKNIENYRDFSEIGDWAFKDVLTVVSAEVFKGTGEETLSPLSTFKYSEAAESIRNLLYIESTQ